MKLDERTPAKVSCVGVFTYFLVSAGLGSICWPYTINTWLIYLDKDPALQWWQGALIGLVPLLGQLSIPFAVVTWILMLFLT